MSQPALEPPARTREPAGAVERLARRLGEHFASAWKHREQGGLVAAAAAVPGTGGEECGGVVGAQGAEAVRRVTTGGGASEQRRARQVNAHRGAGLPHAYDEVHVGVARVDRRPSAEARLQVVADGVLGTQGHELRVA